MKNNKRMTSWLLAGLAAGAVAWYLFGTRSGKDLLNNLADSAQDLGNTLREEAKDKLNNLTSQASDLVGQVKSRANSVY